MTDRTFAVNAFVTSISLLAPSRDTISSMPDNLANPARQSPGQFANANPARQSPGQFANANPARQNRGQTAFRPGQNEAGGGREGARMQVLIRLLLERPKVCMWPNGGGGSVGRVCLNRLTLKFVGRPGNIMNMEIMG